jgi:hypothetical protein
MKDILPSMPKGEIVGNMATTKMTQMIKVVIDGNRFCMENRCRNTEAETQTLQHKCKHRRCNTNANCCNKNANTVAATQMRTVATQMQTQTLKHSAETELEHRS